MLIRDTQVQARLRADYHMYGRVRSSLMTDARMQVKFLYAAAAMRNNGRRKRYLYTEFIIEKRRVRQVRVGVMRVVVCRGEMDKDQDGTWVYYMASSYKRHTSR